VLALKCGERYRLARALAMEACYSATAGGPARDRTATLVELAAELANQLGHPHAIGLARYASGVAAFLEGRFEEARPAARDAETIFREQCTGVAWEVSSARVFHLGSLAFLGELSELARCVRRNLHEALDRGDRYAAANLRTGLANLTWLFPDDPDAAQTQVDETMADWSQRGFHIQHYYDLLAQAGIDLYRGQGAIAHRRVVERWGELTRSLLLMVQFVRIDVQCIRARTALAASFETTEPAALLSECARYAGKIEREKMAWALPLAQLLRAGIAERKDARDEARDLYKAATRAFRAARMGLYEAISRFRYGELAGGDEGQASVRAAEEWMIAQGVVKPARIVQMLAPSKERV
jgi:eukaryotic-like serine/threonine-protein kinase